MLYYSLIYPFLTYGIQVWGLTYPTYLKPVTTLQKRVVRIMTFSDPRSYSELLDLIQYMRIKCNHPWKEVKAKRTWLDLLARFDDLNFSQV